jgi:hypothetical protein
MATDAAGESSRTVGVDVITRTALTVGDVEGSTNAIYDVPDPLFLGVTRVA